MLSCLAQMVYLQESYSTSPTCNTDQYINQNNSCSDCLPTFICNSVSLTPCHHLNANLCQSNKIISCLPNSYPTPSPTSISYCQFCAFDEICSQNVIRKCRLGYRLDNDRCLKCTTSNLCDGLTEVPCSSVTGASSCQNGLITSCSPQFLLQKGRCVTCPATGKCDGTSKLQCYLDGANVNVPYWQDGSLKCVKQCGAGAVCDGNQFLGCSRNFVLYNQRCYCPINKILLSGECVTFDNFSAQVCGDGSAIVQVFGAPICAKIEDLEDTEMVRCGDSGLLENCACVGFVEATSQGFKCQLCPANFSCSGFSKSCKVGFSRFGELCLCPVGLYFSGMSGDCTLSQVSGSVRVENCSGLEFLFFKGGQIFCSQYHDILEYGVCGGGNLQDCFCSQYQIFADNKCFDCRSGQVCENFSFKGCKQNFVLINDSCICPLGFCHDQQNNLCMRCVFVYQTCELDIIFHKGQYFCIENESHPIKHCPFYENLEVMTCSCSSGFVYKNYQNDNYECSQLSVSNDFLFDSCKSFQILINNWCVCLFGYVLLNDECQPQQNVCDSYLSIYNNQFVCALVFPRCLNGQLITNCSCFADQFIDGLRCSDCPQNFTCIGFEKRCIESFIYVQLLDRCVCAEGYMIINNACVSVQNAECSIIQIKYQINDQIVCLEVDSGLAICEDQQFLWNCGCRHSFLIVDNLCVQCPENGSCVNWSFTHCPFMQYYGSVARMCYETYIQCVVSNQLSCTQIDYCNAFVLVQNQLRCYHQYQLQLKSCRRNENVSSCYCQMLDTRNYVENDLCKYCPKMQKYNFNTCEATIYCYDHSQLLQNNCYCQLGYHLNLEKEQCDTVDINEYLSDKLQYCKNYITSVGQQLICFEQNQLLDVCANEQKLSECLCAQNQFIHETRCFDCPANAICKNFKIRCVNGFVLFFDQQCLCPFSYYENATFCSMFPTEFASQTQCPDVVISFEDHLFCTPTSILPPCTNNSTIQNCHCPQNSIITKEHCINCAFLNQTCAYFNFKSCIAGFYSVNSKCLCPIGRHFSFESCTENGSGDVVAADQAYIVSLNGQLLSVAEVDEVRICADQSQMNHCFCPREKVVGDKCVLSEQMQKVEAQERRLAIFLWCGIGLAALVLILVVVVSVLTYHSCKRRAKAGAKVTKSPAKLQLNINDKYQQNRLAASTRSVSQSKVKKQRDLKSIVV